MYMVSLDKSALKVFPNGFLQFCLVMRIWYLFWFPKIEIDPVNLLSTMWYFPSTLNEFYQTAYVIGYNLIRNIVIILFHSACNVYSLVSANHIWVDLKKKKDIGWKFILDVISHYIHTDSQYVCRLFDHHSKWATKTNDWKSKCKCGDSAKSDWQDKFWNEKKKCIQTFIDLNTIEASPID